MITNLEIPRNKFKISIFYKFKLDEKLIIY